MMTLRAWFQPPRHLLALFLLITLVPSALLVYSGWRLIQPVENTVSALK